jgi:hypothetical protein
VECEKGQGQELGPVIADAMVSAFPLNPPLTVEWTVTDRSYGHA